FSCEGADDKAREAKLRLDLREIAAREGESGQRRVVPGKPDESEMIRRIFATEESDIMPPPAAKNLLSEHDKLVLRRRVGAGAEYKQHWAFLPPRQAPLPPVKQADWPRNAID